MCVALVCLSEWLYVVSWQPLYQPGSGEEGELVACAVTETKCPLLTALFSLLSSLRRVTFLPEGVIVGFQNLHGVLTHQTNNIGGEHGEKCLELPEMARKLIFSFLKKLPPPKK